MHAGLASFIATAPVLHAIEPFRRFIRAAARPYRSTRTGKTYLGEGQPVIVCPTFRKGPESTTVFRGTLEEAGFRVYDWGLGMDMGPGSIRLSSCLRRLEERVIDVVESDGAPVTLLGWG